MKKRTIAAIGAGAVVLAGVGGLVVGAALEDPDEPVAAIELSGAPSQDGGSRSGSVRVPALETLAGRVALEDDDPDDLVVDGVDLDFGPDRWVRDAPALADFDGDGRVEPLRDELAGLVGTEATFDVRFDDDGDDADVYSINGQTYRSVGGPAPWQPADGIGEEEARAAAIAAVGEGAEVVDVDADEDGPVAWEVEVRAADGREHDVLLDAAGQVLAVRAD